MVSDKKQRKRTKAASKPKGGGVAAARVLSDKDRKRVRTLLQAKLVLTHSYEKEIAQVRGAMLGIIEAFDLTAKDANDLLGIHYFAELEPQDPDGHIHTFDRPELQEDIDGDIELMKAMGDGSTDLDRPTPEPDPVEPDEVTVG